VLADGVWRCRGGCRPPGGLGGPVKLRSEGIRDPGSGIRERKLEMSMPMVEPPTMRQERQQLRSQANWTFVNAYEFRSLAVSARRLLRADEPAAGLRGLLDPETGTHFVTEEENLFAL
jgi:hypothetical protein